ncbi:hypothetical protein O206_22525 [Ochrobactrum sp. EGD-AQ16]|nr:hypothetical protein O206_22525 [Ochrobactrum sp. EGD-AQ16]
MTDYNTLVLFLGGGMAICLAFGIAILIAAQK